MNQWYHGAQTVAPVQLAGAYRWICLAADCGSKVASFGRWAAANCAALPTANAGQYATSHNRIVNHCRSAFTVMHVPLTFSLCGTVNRQYRHAIALISHIARRSP